jgi:hypothetical protein
MFLRAGVGFTRARNGAATMHFAGVLALEGISPSADFPEGVRVNWLVGADPVAPAGGVAFHDIAVWLRPV